MPSKKKANQPGWKKYWKPARSQYLTPTEKKGGSSNHFGLKNFESWLPEFYEGPTNRLVRYTQYDQMDMDHEVNAALDTIAEFSTLESESNNLPFKIESIDDEMSSSETEIINKLLSQWCNLNEFNKRIFRIFRNVIKYGDQVFIRDPDTYKLMWVDVANVEKIMGNEADGKKLEIYHIKDLDFNLKDMVASNVHNSSTGGTNNNLAQPISALNPTPHLGIPQNSYVQGTHSGATEVEATEVDAAHILHISLTEGMDNSWPFGVSILERIYKIFKQKELLEDSVLIYRIHRAPQRRQFNIHTGDMPPHRAAEYIETIKNQVNQRRIPSRNGEGGSIVDATYSPMSMLEDYYFAVNSDGQQSSVTSIDGDMSAISQIDDMKYFNNKMLRALAVPSSYLPTGPEDGSQQYADGRISSAFIQEFRFDRYCRRLQRSIVDYFDREFKLYIKWRGIEFDSSLFKLKFGDPQNFSEYRQLEIDQMRINVFSSIENVPYISKQFAMKRYLGLSDFEIRQNEKLWQKENQSKNNNIDDTEVVSERDIKQMNNDDYDNDDDNDNDNDNDQDEFNQE